MSAFKTYVIKEYVGKVGIEREVQIALKEELEAERSGTPPDLSSAITTEQLVEALNSSSVLGNEFRKVAAEKQAQVFVPKKTILDKLKDWFV